ncbi:MAG TPA: hypothetical protein VGK73_03975 [Polyangiaceae bacterium]
MPRGIPKKKKRRYAADAEAPESDDAPTSAVAPVAAVAPSLGGAIESVRLALEPFDDATRKRIVRAAHMTLK